MDQFEKFEREVSIKLYKLERKILGYSRAKFNYSEILLKKHILKILSEIMFTYEFAFRKASEMKRGSEERSKLQWIIIQRFESLLELKIKQHRD